MEVMFVEMIRDGREVLTHRQTQSMCVLSILKGLGSIRRYFGLNILGKLNTFV